MAAFQSVNLEVVWIEPGVGHTEMNREFTVRWKGAII